jgi:hypothetical protein
MSVESLLDRTVEMDELDIPDYLYMRNIHLARLLDETEDIEHIKYIFLVEMMSLERENNLLKHDVMTLHNDVKALVNAVQVLQG